MSDLIIKGMEMPKNCRKCDFTHCTRFGQKLCTFLNEATSIKQKLPDCPVSKIPTPHGDLIDRDKLIQLFLPIMEFPEDERIMYVDSFIRALKNAPTIIEAEQGDG